MHSIALLTLACLLPPFIVIFGNDHRAFRATALRFFVATGIGWLLFYVYASSFAWAGVGLPPDGDGARMVFALFFGWVAPAVLSAVGWWLHRLVASRDVRAAS